MIKFFRNIRKKLLREGKTSRYLTYAVGEIILVVIGILIALQINNWNEERKMKRTESHILEGLKNEFKGASLEVTTDQKRRVEIDSALHRLQAVINEEKKVDFLLDSIPSIIEGLLSYRFYTPSHPVLDDLQSSGRMDVIQSDSLRHLITRYIQDRDRLQVVEKRDMDFVQNEAEEFVRSYINLSWLFSDNPELQNRSANAIQNLIGDTEFGSIVILRIHKLEVCLFYAKSLQETVHRISSYLENGQ